MYGSLAGANTLLAGCWIRGKDGDGTVCLHWRQKSKVVLSYGRPNSFFCYKQDKEKGLRNILVQPSLSLIPVHRSQTK